LVNSVDIIRNKYSHFTAIAAPQKFNILGYASCFSRLETCWGIISTKCITNWQPFCDCLGWLLHGNKSYNEYGSWNCSQ